MDVDELISRGALIEQLELLATHEDDWRQSCILGIVHTISKAPAVDAVEVVRCKDCKLTARTKSQLKILYWCNKFGNVMRPDDYCSFGERMEE